MKFFKFIALTFLYLFILLGLESLLLMLTTGMAFNSITFPIVNNIDFLSLLIKNNIGSGLRELIMQPVLILGSISVSDDYLTALYYYPISSLLHIVFAGFIASRMLKNPTQLIRIPFIFASLLFLVSINYVWLVGCCGATPGWTLDTLLLNYVLSTNVSSGEHMSFYETLYDWMYVLQISMMLISVIWLRWLTHSK